MVRFINAPLRTALPILTFSMLTALDIVHGCNYDQEVEGEALSASCISSAANLSLRDGFAVKRSSQSNQSRQCQECGVACPRRRTLFQTITGGLVC